MQRRAYSARHDRPRRARARRCRCGTRGVAGAQHAGRVGEDVGPALEHEPDDTERRAPGLDLPRAVVVRSLHRVASSVGVLPRRAGPAIIPCRIDGCQRQPRRRSAACRRRDDVGLIGLVDRFEDCVVGQTDRRSRRRIRSIADRLPQRARRMRRPPRPPLGRPARTRRVGCAAGRRSRARPPGDRPERNRAASSSSTTAARSPPNGTS